MHICVMHVARLGIQILLIPQGFIEVTYFGLQTPFSVQNGENAWKSETCEVVCLACHCSQKSDSLSGHTGPSYFCCLLCVLKLVKTLCLRQANPLSGLFAKAEFQTGL